MKRILLLIFSPLLILFQSYSTFGQPLITPDIIKNADTYLSRMVPFGFNGTVLIAEKDKIVLNKGYGMAEREQGIPNGPDIIYSLGSIVKPFTATLIMKLVQDRQIELTDPLAKFFPDVPSDKKSIEIHHLLSHSSGFPEAIGSDKEYITKENYIHEVWETPLAFIPGAYYLYSNVGFTMLAMVVEKVTGKNYEEYLFETILKPAGMKNTGYTLPDWDITKLAHNFFAGHDNGTFMDREFYPTWNLIGNGGMLSTTEDMYRFYRLIKSNKLLTAETKNKMFTPVFMEDAYGWVNIDNGEIIQHNGGGSDGNGAVFRWFPKDDLFLMIFTNSTFQDKPGFLSVEQPLQDIIFGKEILLPPEVIEISEAVSLEKFEGSYQLSGGAEFTLQNELRTFKFHPENQQAVSLLFNMHEGSSDWIAWNNKISSIMKAVVEEEKYDSLAKITEDPDRLKELIENEIKMEGYEKPRIRVLFSIQINPRIFMTMTAISEEIFDEESMLMQLYFENEQFTGMGINFGRARLPEMTFVPVCLDLFTGYNFSFNRECTLRIRYDQSGLVSSMIFNNGPEQKTLKKE